MQPKYIYILLLIILSSCGSKTSTTAEQVPTETESLVVLNDAQLANAKIETGQLDRRSISTTLTLHGKIDVPPQNMVSVSMPLGGFLKSTQLLPGMPVRKGEVIAVMEDQQYIALQQEYLMSKSKNIYAKAEYQRQQTLNQSKASSDKVYQQSEMDYQNASITENALAEKLRLVGIKPELLTANNLSRTIPILAPITGYVSKVNVNIGKYVNPSDILFELINPEDIHLNLQVFEKDLALLAVGQKLNAFNNTYPDKKHPCEIILISQDLSADRSAEVHCHFEDYDRLLLPGMYMNAEVQVKTNNSLGIAEEAIVNYLGKDYVFVAIDNHQFEMIEITRGNTENGFSEITSKNTAELETKKIVTKGAYSLLMQLKNKSE